MRRANLTTIVLLALLLLSFNAAADDKASEKQVQVSAVATTELRAASVDALKAQMADKAVVVALRNQNKAWSSQIDILLDQIRAQQIDVESQLDSSLLFLKMKGPFIAQEQVISEVVRLNDQLSALHQAAASLEQCRGLSSKIDIDLISARPTGEICNGGACGSVPAVLAAVAILTGGLSDELNKAQPFGPNNEITKAAGSIRHFIECFFGCH